MNDRLNPTVGRRELLRVLAVGGAAAAASAAPLAPAVADSESDDEKRKARYQANSRRGADVLPRQPLPGDVTETTDAGQEGGTRGSPRRLGRDPDDAIGRRPRSPQLPAPLGSRGRRSRGARHAVA